MGAKPKSVKLDYKDLIDPKLVSSDPDLTELGQLLESDNMVEMEKLHMKTMTSSSSQLKMTSQHPKYPDIADCVKYIKTSAPKITLQPSRQKGTSIWPKSEMTPGPGAYDHANSCTFGAYARNRPAFSMSNGKHLQMNYRHDPYATYSSK